LFYVLFSLMPRGFLSEFSIISIFKPKVITYCSYRWYISWSEVSCNCTRLLYTLSCYTSSLFRWLAASIGCICMLIG